ncbi:MAG: hypothetical protein ACFB4J_13140 [Elainellaceae cyanobacterium]
MFDLPPIDWGSHLGNLHGLSIAQFTQEDIDLLTSQLEVLKESNAQLGRTFSYFISAVTVISTILAIAAGFAVYFLGKNVQEFRQTAQQTVEAAVQRTQQEAQQRIDREVAQATRTIRQDLDRQLTALVKTEVENVERTLQKERIVSETLVTYYCPELLQPPKEYALLEDSQRFQDVTFCQSLLEVRQSPGHVVVLDVINWKAAQVMDERDRLVEEQLTGLLGLDSWTASTVLVVYVAGRLSCLNQVGNSYVLPANNPVTLVGHVVNGAYVAYGGH